MVVYSAAGEVLLLRRSKPFDFWQSVTGSLDADESHADAAVRELREETGLTTEGRLTYSGVARQFTIDPRWRNRFLPGVTENVEYEWRYELAEPVAVHIARDEHSEYQWLPVGEAINTVWSWTNRDAIAGITTRR